MAGVSRVLRPGTLRRNSSLLLGSKAGTSSQALSAQNGGDENGMSSVSPPTIDFEDACSVFAAKSTSELLKSCAVLSSCRIQPLVHHARTAMDTLSAVLGRRLATKIVETTYYDHFCLGYAETAMACKLAKLKQHGIMGIMNYAAEDDVSGTDAKDSASSELGRDLNAAKFVDCTKVCDTETHRAFLELKISALADPDLLAKMSNILVETGGNTDRGSASSRLEELMQARLCKSDFEAFMRLRGRLDTIAQAIKNKGGVRMLIDAEATYVQPAMDTLTIALQQKYNREEAMVFNTYQLYLKDSEARVETDMERALKEGWQWGAKTVRGAYIEEERRVGEQDGSGCPIHDCMEDTHANYNRCVDYLMKHVARGKGTELMVATHNQQSVENAISNMQKLSLKAHHPGSGIYFGQILGMADNLTYPLGANGYNAYKVCAYGEVNQCMNFLIRRGIENSNVLGGCEKEVRLARTAIMERVKSKLWKRSPHNSDSHQAYA